MEETNLVEQPKETKAIAASNIGFATALMNEIQEDFLKVNEGLSLDFVYLGSWLTINGKGKFVDADDDKLVYGEDIDVVVAQGQQKFMLWGKEGTPESGRVLIAEPTMEQAIEKLKEIKESADFDDYDEEDIQSKYLAYVIPVETLREEVPKLYLLSMPSTAKIKWGKYAFDGIYKGKYKNLGIPSRTAVSSVVTKITTKEQINNDKQKYLTMEFEAVKMFKIEEYRSVN